MHSDWKSTNQNPDLWVGSILLALVLDPRLSMTQKDICGYVSTQSDGTRGEMTVYYLPPSTLLLFSHLPARIAALLPHAVSQKGNGNECLFLPVSARTTEIQLEDVLYESFVCKYFQSNSSVSSVFISKNQNPAQLDKNICLHCQTRHKLASLLQTVSCTHHLSQMGPFIFSPALGHLKLGTCIYMLKFHLIKEVLSVCNGYMWVRSKEMPKAKDAHTQERKQNRSNAKLKQNHKSGIQWSPPIQVGPGKSEYGQSKFMDYSKSHGNYTHISIVLICSASFKSW